MTNKQCEAHPQPKAGNSNLNLKKRKSIPKATEKAVLKEFRHLCAICGNPEPQLHHIDEDPSNNDTLNLLPLCPNCHLLDAHDPTSRPTPEKLKLFRKYKDPLILHPRFDPIFKRMEFLGDANMSVTDEVLFNHKHSDLLTFIECLEMGSYYRPKLLEIKEDPRKHLLIELKSAGKPLELAGFDTDGFLQAAARWLVNEMTIRLLIEQLRYQSWPRSAAKLSNQA
jgi:hypothetical protein